MAHLLNIRSRAIFHRYLKSGVMTVVTRAFRVTTAFTASDLLRNEIVSYLCMLVLDALWDCRRRLCWKEPFDSLISSRGASSCLRKATETKTARAGWPLGDGPVEGDGVVKGRREVTGYHNAERIPLPVPGERSDDGMESLRGIW